MYEYNRFIIPVVSALVTECQQESQSVSSDMVQSLLNLIDNFPCDLEIARKNQ